MLYLHRHFVFLYVSGMQYSVGWVDQPSFQPDNIKLMLPDLLINKIYYFHIFCLRVATLKKPRLLHTVVPHAPWFLGTEILRKKMIA